MLVKPQKLSKASRGGWVQPYSTVSVLQTRPGFCSLGLPGPVQIWGLWGGSKYTDDIPIRAHEPASPEQHEPGGPRVPLCPTHLLLPSGLSWLPHGPSGTTQTPQPLLLVLASSGPRPGNPSDPSLQAPGPSRAPMTPAPVPQA